MSIDMAERRVLHRRNARALQSAIEATLSRRRRAGINAALCGRSMALNSHLYKAEHDRSGLRKVNLSIRLWLKHPLTEALAKVRVVLFLTLAIDGRRPNLFVLS